MRKVFIIFLFGFAFGLCGSKRVEGFLQSVLRFDFGVWFQVPDRRHDREKP